MKGLQLTIFMILCLFLVSCGLPSADELDDLQPPMSLSVQLECVSGSPSKFHINFYGYNTESAFSGYNIYVTYSPIDQTTAENSIKSYVTTHNPSSGTSFNSSTEQNYIVQNSNNDYPSLPYSILPAGYNSEPTLISAILGEFQAPDLMNDGRYQVGITYGFGVTAISNSNNDETVSSNVVLKEFSSDSCDINS